ncbi:hypothetical protein CAAN1_27S00694 [[Candida] anglica]|uniref:PH domain-containing protein n=1 Tax=[Candida] anglica TaxID=148631 RepID=A0ABP0EC28_9ASCO
MSHANPLAVALPHTFNSPSEYPTEILANRFQAWRSIIKDLVSYLKEFASVEEEIVRQQMRLQQAVGISTGSSATANVSSSSTSNHKNEDIVAINKFFLPIGNGSVQDLPTILTKFHQQNVTNGSKTLKDINNIIVPRLEELRKDLLVKIKEIKNLQNDFKTNLGKELGETKVLLQQYQQAIDLSGKLEAGTNATINGLPHLHEDHAKHDPYLVKLRLDRQLKKQLSEESYLYDAYANLQNSGGKLESIIVLEVQNYLSMFLNLVETENSTIPNYLVPNIKNGFLNKDPGFEWEGFIARNSAVGNGNGSSGTERSFIDLSFPSRKISDLSIPRYETPLNIPIREGFLERRSKFLKSYSSGWYVLTCNYIHEFKSPDRKRDPQPVMSLSLDTCSVSEHSKDDGKNGGVYKFVLYSKGSNIRHRSHNWVFRTDTFKNMIDWYNDIKSLTSLATPESRARWVSKTKGLGGSKKVSRPASILSNGTNGRTIRSGESVETRGIGAGSVKSKSKVGQRLSTHGRIDSPRLINSDGTAVAQSSPTVGANSGRNDAMGAHSINSGAPGVTGTGPVPHTMVSTPVAQKGAPPNIPMNATPVPPAGNPGAPGGVPPTTATGAPVYYITPGQQQYYDPVQQQYYTISPSIQPQYFPVSPQNQTQYFIPQNGAQPGQPGQPGQHSQPGQPGQPGQHSQPGQPGQPGQGTAAPSGPIYPQHFYPQSPSLQPQYADVTSLGSYLPYPPPGVPGPTPVKHEDYTSLPADGAPMGHEIHPTISRNGEIIISRENLNDEVDTLPSVVTDNEEDERH